VPKKLTGEVKYRADGYIAIEAGYSHVGIGDHCLPEIMDNLKKGQEGEADAILQDTYPTLEPEQRLAIIECLKGEELMNKGEGECDD